VQINKGSDDGITVGSAVVGPAGLIGRVDEVSGGRATVLLLTDPSFQVGVRIGAQGEVAVARGAGARRALRVSLVAPSAAIRKGDSVVTSGLNGSPFPAGVPVGVLGSVTREVGDLDLNVSLDPVADLAHARYVRVLRWESS
jgi:rod shape-determining protein MreC